MRQLPQILNFCMHSHVENKISRCSCIRTEDMSCHLHAYMSIEAKVNSKSLLGHTPFIRGISLILVSTDFIICSNGLKMFKFHNSSNASSQHVC